jgi:hypothetical protein
MATGDAIARIRADALRDLKDTGPQIAAQLGIEPPQLNFFFRDKDYQQAKELAALAEFNTRLLSALPTQSEGGDDDQSGAAPIPKRRSDRPAVSQR